MTERLSFAVFSNGVHMSRLVVVYDQLAVFVKLSQSDRNRTTKTPISIYLLRIQCSVKILRKNNGIILEPIKSTK